MALHTIVLEAFYSGDWHVVPTNNRRDVVVTQGQQDQLTKSSPMQLDIEVNNRGGEYSPDNPESSLYGLIGRNTPVRLSVDGVFEFHGEVEAWPQRWDKSGQDFWVPITAYGDRQRLGLPGQARPARSALRRFIPAQDVAAGYWPMEGYKQKPQRVESAIAGVADASHRTFTATSLFPLDWAGEPTLSGSQALPQLQNNSTAIAGITANVDTAPNPALGFAFWTRTATLDTDATNSVATQAIQTATLDGGSVQFSLTLITYPPGSSLATVPADGEVQIQAAVVVDSVLVDTVLVTDLAFVDGWRHVYARLSTSGADVAVSLRIDDTVVGTGTLSPAAIGTVKKTTFNLFAQDAVNDEVGTISGGHPVLLSGSTTNMDTFAGGMYDAGLGFPGEEAHDRIERLCDEEGIAITITGSDSEVLGPQPIAPFLDLLEGDPTSAGGAAPTDMGILYEPRDASGFAYRTRATLYNQTPVTLTYGQKEMGSSLEPTPDLDSVQNDVTVTRIGGSSARSVQETGTLNVQSPVDDVQGVGRFAVELFLPLNWDEQTNDQASWRKWVGTWPGPRVPALVVDIDALLSQGKTSLVDDLVALVPGDMLRIANVPLWVSSSLQLDLLAIGFTRVASLTRRIIEINLVPAGPYEVGEYAANDADAGDEPVSRYDTAGCETATGIWLPSGWSGDVSTPDNAALDITGDLDLRADVTPVSWASGSIQVLLSKYGTTTQKSYALRLSNTGLLNLFYSTDGSADTSVSSTEPVSVHRTRLAVRATIDVNNGAGGRTVTFYTGTATGGLGDADVTWVQLGDPVITAGTVTIFSGNEALEVGDRGSAAQPFNGIVHAIQVRNGIGGTIVSHPRFDQQATGTTSFSNLGLTWTLTGDPAIYHDFVSGTDTKMLVSTATLGGQEWTTDSDDLPMDLRVSGAVLEVTAVTATGKPQLLTVTQAAVNGVVKVVEPGESISLARPVVYAL